MSQIIKCAAFLILQVNSGLLQGMLHTTSCYILHACESLLRESFNRAAYGFGNIALQHCIYTVLAGAPFSGCTHQLLKMVSLK